MRENTKLHIRSSDGRTPEDPKYQNTVLENNYKIGLFDLAYLLAISINGEFMPKNKRRYYFGEREELEKVKRLLDKTRSHLPPRLFYDRLRNLIDEYLESINRGLEVTQLPPGRGLNAKTKLILLWTYMLRRKDTARYPETEGVADSRLGEEILGIKKSINWGDYYKLLSWFYLKLKGCPYVELFMPNKDELKEKTLAKSLWLKHVDRGDNTKNWYGAKARIWAYISLQRLLAQKTRITLDQYKRVKLFVEPYPIMLVKFNINSLEIGRLKDGKIIANKYASVGNPRQSVRKVKDIVLNTRNPTIIFPDGKIFESEYYQPPSQHFGGPLPDDIWEPQTQ